MVYKLEISRTQYRSGAGRHHVFPALKENLGDLRFKDGHEVETTVTLALIPTGDTKTRSRIR